MTDPDLTPEAVERPLDEVFDTQRDVEQNPCGAWQAIQALSAALEAERAEKREAALLLHLHMKRAEAAEVRLKEAVDVMWTIGNEYDPSDDWLNARTMYEIAHAFLSSLEGYKP